LNYKNNFKAKNTMNRTKGRMPISKNQKENLDVAKKIYNKHAKLGAASP
jgi:hypothetical protein